MPRQSNLPLYSGARFQAEGHTIKPKDGQHPGLVWERFFDGYMADFAGFLNLPERRDPRTKDIVQEAQQGKADFIEGFAKTVDGGCRSFALRQMALLHALGGESRVFSLAWYFATGLGNDHPTENGFTWHPTLGTPYLPGSGVKGLVRGWMEWNDPNDARIEPWFGTQTKEKEEVAERSGWFSFFDAVPIGAVKLGADVMTPHCGDWYEKGDDIRAINDEPDPDVVPADWHSPVPVPFLVVKQASFLFGVAVREGLPDRDLEDAKSALPQVMEILKDALQWAGAGAKTAVGYGRMEPDEEAYESLKKEMDDAVDAERKARAAAEAERREAEEAAGESRAIAALSPLDPELESKVARVIATWPEKGLPAWQKLHQSLFAASPSWADAEKPKVAARVRAMMETAGTWVPDENSKKGHRARQIQALLEQHDRQT